MVPPVAALSPKRWRFGNASNMIKPCYRNARASLRVPSSIAVSLNEANPRSNPLGSGVDNVYRSSDRVSTPAANAALSASSELMEFLNRAAV